MIGLHVRLAAVLLAVMACSDDSVTNPDPDPMPEAELNFLRPAINAPPLAQTSASFYAVKGSDRELRLFYTDGDEFLRLRIDDKSLDRRPDGTAIALGDSVLITVSVSDASRLIVDLQPAGLKFADGEPAELRIRYANADDDIDDDGDVDGEDDAAERRFAIWRQERPGDLWERIGSVISSDLEDVRADLTGFTRYAIAY